MQAMLKPELIQKSMRKYKCKKETTIRKRELNRNWMVDNPQLTNLLCILMKPFEANAKVKTL